MCVRSVLEFALGAITSYQNIDEPFWYWHSEEQTRVGGLERKAYEEKKNLAVKVNKIAQMIVRILTFEGLQPMVTEATFFTQGVDQCTLEVQDSSRN